MDKQIRTFILSDGTELVAEAERTPTGKWRLFRPFKNFTFAAAIPTPQGLHVNISAQLVPAFPLSCDSSFEFSEDKFLCEPSLAVSKVASAWTQQVTGLQVVQQGQSIIQP